MPRLGAVLLCARCLLAAALSGTPPSPSVSLSSSTSTPQRAALREWLVPLCPGLDGSRAALEEEEDGGGGRRWAVRATRAYNRGQTVFSIGDGALLTARCLNHCGCFFFLLFVAGGVCVCVCKEPKGRG